MDGTVGLLSNVTPYNLHINRLHNRSITFSDCIRTLWNFMQRTWTLLNIRKFKTYDGFLVSKICVNFANALFFNFYKYHNKKLIYNPKCQLDIAPPQTKLKVEWIWVSSCWSCSRWPIYSPNMSKSIRVDDLILPSFPPFVEDARKRIKEIENFPTRKDDLLLFNYPKSGKRYI